ncbi:MAG TPA: beta-1,6-N-acetylglucosaminyltransferase [Sphingomonadaceae bacterium]|jgi:hypothetical protein|nr:beta-1,6-N-acetylglucosaminyltransferase [Sphingomonadaceae bacterium]
MPKFAYFIMVHHKPAQFEWLMRAIHDPGDLFLIHVDLKSRLGLKADRKGVMDEVRRIVAGRPNVRLLPSRFTNWGGWSLSRILLDAMKTALAVDKDWSHFINLSGQCYPLKPLGELKRQIVEAGDVAHVEMRSIDSLPADDWHLQSRRIFETPVRAFALGRKPPPRDFTMGHKGSQWVILPRAFCAWAAAAPETQRIAAYLKTRQLSDELIAQALVENGPYRDRIAHHYGRAIVWPGPKLFGTEDLPFLQASPAWFGRKFDVATDARVLLTLAETGGYRPGPIPERLA